MPQIHIQDRWTAAQSHCGFGESRYAAYMYERVTDAPQR